MTRAHTLPLLGLVLALAAGPAAAQERRGGADVTERFSGVVRLGPEPGAGEVDVALQEWIVAGGARVELPSVDRGLVRVELMAGELETLAEDRRVRRVEGASWTLEPGRSMIVETEDDSAVLMLTIVRQR